MKIKCIEKKCDNLYKVSIVSKSFFGGYNNKVIYVSHFSCGLYVYSNTGDYLPSNLNTAVKLAVPMIPNIKDFIIFDEI